MRAPTIVGLLAILALGGCEDPPPPAPPPPPPPRPPAPIASPRPVAGSTAFALTPVGDGAVLIYGVPERLGGGVRVVRLGPGGETRGEERPLATEGAAAGAAAEARPIGAREIEAAASGRRLGVAWTLDPGPGFQARIEAAYSPDGGETFAAVEALGPTTDPAPGARGRLAASAAADGTLVVYHRLIEADCQSSEGRCARISRHRIGGGAGGERGDEPLEIASPCEPLITGALFRDGTFYHGLCNRSPESTTTVYAIRPSVAYAAPMEAGAGCTPLGLAPLDEGVAVLSRCQRGIEALALDSMGRPGVRLTGANPSARCRRGRPELTLRSGEQTLTLSPNAAADHLELLLPVELAPAGSRAIWTGESLLVALYTGGDLALHRYECDDDELARTDSF